MCESERKISTTNDGNGGVLSTDGGGACCSSRVTDDDHITFQYEWPVRICKRRVNQSDELVLNVSPAFSTALDGVQFTWALKISDDCTASDYYYEDSTSNVSISLYYKDGPTPDVHIIEAKIHISDSEGKTKLPTLRFREYEWTRGSGWSVNVADQCQTQLNDFIREHIGDIVHVVVNIKMKTKIFSPLLYLPNVDGANKKLEDACIKYLEDVKLNHEIVPKLETLLNDPEYMI